MRMWAADEVRVSHADDFDVIDVAAFACDESPVFLAHYAGANTFNTHRISPCRAAGPARKS
jgi:hypothetical protein